MALTVAQCAEWIALSPGGKLHPVLSTQKIVNLAGQHFCGMSDWRFLKRRSSFLDTVADQEYVELPAEYGGMVSLVGVGEQWQMEPTGLDEINRLRNASSSTSQGPPYRWSIVDNDPQERYLEIWPTPAASVSNSLSIVYRAKWVDLDDDADYVVGSDGVLPDYCEMLFIRVMQAVAAGFQESEEATTSLRLQELMTSPEMAAARRQDNGFQRDRGELEGAMSNYAHTCNTILEIEGP